MSGRVRVLCGREAVGKNCVYKPDRSSSSLVGEVGRLGRSRVHLRLQLNDAITCPDAIVLLFPQSHCLPALGPAYSDVEEHHVLCWT